MTKTQQQVSRPDRKNRRMIGHLAKGSSKNHTKGLVSLSRLDYNSYLQSGCEHQIILQPGSVKCHNHLQSLLSSKSPSSPNDKGFQQSQLTTFENSVLGSGILLSQLTGLQCVGHRKTDDQSLFTNYYKQKGLLCKAHQHQAVGTQADTKNSFQDCIIEQQNSIIGNTEPSHSQQANYAGGFQSHLALQAQKANTQTGHSQFSQNHVYTNKLQNVTTIAKSEISEPSKAQTQTMMIQNQNHMLTSSPSFCQDNNMSQGGNTGVDLLDLTQNQLEITQQTSQMEELQLNSPEVIKNQGHIRQHQCQYHQQIQQMQTSPTHAEQVQQQIDQNDEINQQIIMQQQQMLMDHLNQKVQFQPCYMHQHQQFTHNQVITNKASTINQQRELQSRQAAFQKILKLDGDQRDENLSTLQSNNDAQTPNSNTTYTAQANQTIYTNTAQNMNNLQSANNNVSGNSEFTSSSNKQHQYQQQMQMKMMVQPSQPKIQINLNRIDIKNSQVSNMKKVVLKQHPGPLLSGSSQGTPGLSTGQQGSLMMQGSSMSPNNIQNIDCDQAQPESYYLQKSQQTKAIKPTTQKRIDKTSLKLNSPLKNEDIASRDSEPNKTNFTVTGMHLYTKYN